MERAFQKMSDFEMIAQLAQSVAWEMLQPYVAAREDNPFVTGFDYFKNIYDKTTAVPTENDLVTREIYNWMVDHGGEKSTRRLMVGVEGTLVPPIKKKDLGYGVDGRYADQIFQIVGRERFLTAFLTGDVELVGLPA